MASRSWATPFRTCLVQMSRRPRWKRTTAARGNSPVSGPGRHAAELGDGVADAAGPVVREAEVELGNRAVRVGGDESLQLVEPAVRPARKGGADLRLERVIAAEDGERLAPLARVQQVGGLRQILRLPVSARAELEKDGRCARARLRHRTRSPGALAAGLEEHDTHRRRDRRGGDDRHDRHDTCAWAHAAASVAWRNLAIFWKVMPTYRELLQQVKSE